MMEEKQSVSSEAMQFVKSNCFTWCQLCQLKDCEKPELKQKIINGEKID